MFNNCRYEHAGLERDLKSLSSFHLKDILRKYEKTPGKSRNHDFKPVWMNKREYVNLKKTNSIQNSTIKRLYYNEKDKFMTTDGMKKFQGNNQLPEINFRSIREGKKENKRVLSTIPYTKALINGH